jgi:hypothetical protein
MTQLDHAELREYAARDWGAPERLARRHRARQPIRAKVALAIELFEAARATKPGWPDAATRRADFDAHVRLRAMLDAAADVGSR